MTIIDRLRGLALKMQWAKPFAFITGLTALSLVIYIIFEDTGIAADDRYLYPSVLLLLWSLSLGSFVQTFVHVPESPTKAVGFFKRIGRRLQRFYYYILAVTLIGLTLGLIYVSMRAMRIWAG